MCHPVVLSHYLIWAPWFVLYQNLCFAGPSITPITNLNPQTAVEPGPRVTVEPDPRVEISPSMLNGNLDEEEEEEKESDPDWRPGNSAKSKVTGTNHRRFDQSNAQFDIDNVTFPYNCDPCQTSIRDRRDLERHFGTKKHLIKTGRVIKEDCRIIKKARTFAEMISEHNKKVMDGVEIIGDTQQEKVTTFPHWCLPCLTMITNGPQLILHLSTNKHKTKTREMEQLETWKKCAKENIVDNLKCLPCDLVFLTLPLLMQHMESPFHKEMVITFMALQDKKTSNEDEIYDLATEEEEESVEALLEPMDTSDSSVVVQVESSLPSLSDTPALEEITHLNNIPLEDIMLMEDS